MARPINNGSAFKPVVYAKMNTGGFMKKIRERKFINLKKTMTSCSHG